MRARSRTFTSGISLVTALVLVTGVAPTVVAPDRAPEADAAEAEPSVDARPGEVVSLRTRSSSTVRNTNGSMTTTLSAGAVHYRDAHGAWKRIDSSLVAADEPGYAYRNEANSFSAAFKGTLGEDHLRFTAAGQAFRLTLLGANASAGRASGQRMSYPDAVGRVGLTYDLLADGVKETLVLPDASAATAYHFRLTPVGEGATRAERRPDGSWAFYRGTRLAPVFTLDAPVAVDAAGERGVATPTGRNATLTVKRAGAAFLLDLRLDAAWLHAPERRFPVALDPTITIAPPVEDASFPANCANCGAYVSDKIIVGTNGSVWRGAVQFNLAEIPASADVTSASMQAYWAPSCLAAGTGFCNGTSHQVDAHAMSSSWSTSSTSGSLSHDPTPFANATVDAANPAATWVSWPITGTLRNWLTAAKPNFGVLLKRATEPLNASGPAFYGRRYAEPTLQPRLVVTYPGDAVNLLPPDTLHSNGADLRWSPYPATATAPFTTYEVHRSASATFTPSASTLLTSISDSAITSYRDTTAAAGQTFTYKLVTGGAASSGRTVTLPASGKATKVLQPASEEGSATSIAYFTSVRNCAGYGAEPTLWVGPGSDSTSRALVHFDVRDIPAGATITGAVASFWRSNTVATAQTVRIHPATAEWREGTARSACLADSATWYDAYGDVGWASDGGDMGAAATATVTHTTGQKPGSDAFDLTALVSRWVHGDTPNNGLVLRQDQEAPGTGSILNYHSDDFGVAPSLRPKLTVTYVDGSTPSGPTVSLAEPRDGATVHGKTVQLSAAASDDRRVEKVEFLVDGTVVSTDTAEPWGTAWNSTAAANAGHTVTVRATDDAGNVSTSTGVGITVVNTAPPTTSITSLSGPGVPRYAAEVAADHPSGWWRLDEAGPFFADSSGQGNPGRAVGAPTTRVAGAVTNDPDRAIRLNPSSNDYVEVPPTTDFRLNDSFTIEWWGASAGAQNEWWHGFMHYGASWDVGNGWLIFFGADSGAIYFKRDNRSWTSADGLVTDAYRHFAVVYDEPTATLTWYADGAEVNRHTGVTFTDSANSHRLALGRGEADFSNIRLDEPAIYHAALSPARIAAHHAAGSTDAPVVPTDGGVHAYRDAVAADSPIGWWRMGEGAGSTFADASGNGHPGTAHGTPTTGVTGAVRRDPDKAIQFNAPSDDYVSTASTDAFQLNGSFTLEWWASTVGEQPSLWPGFFGYGASWNVGDGWIVYFGRHSGSINFKRDAREWTTPIHLVTSTFRQFAIVYDEPAQTLAFYADGGEVAVHTGVTFATDTGSDRLFLGRADNVSSIRYDEPAIYDKALPAERLAAHYAAGSAPATTVRGTVSVAADASDDVGVARVDFLADGVQFASDATAPFTASWDTLDPIRPAYDGVHVLTTRAYDDGGQVAESSAVPVRVDNSSNDTPIGTTDPPDVVEGDPSQPTGVDVPITNDGDQPLPGTTTAVQYSWVSGDADPVVTAGSPVPLGADLAPGATRTVRLGVAPPALPTGVDRAMYTLKVDVKDTATGTSFAAKGNRPVENQVQVVRALEDTLGLERWHQYSGTQLGAGLGSLVDIANGNNLWNWTPSSSPGRGLSTVVGLTYSSLEKSGPSPVGPGVSLSISSLSRFGAPIDIHPNKADQIAGKANRYVTLTDGDGTNHRFDGRTAADGTVYWDAPPGVHLYLRSTGSSDPNKRWAFSRPDRVTFYYDADGYPTSVEDANGNRIAYTLERIPPGEDGGPVKKRVTAVTDAGGRAYRLDYWSKDEVKKQQTRGLLQRLTDHDGSAFDFDYYDDGNLRTITQRGGTKADGSALPDRTFVFTYTTSNGDAPAIPDPAARVDPDRKTPNQSVLLYSVRDPRGAETTFTYYGPGSSQLRGRVNTVTDRSGAVTTYSYDLAARTTTVTAPLSRTTVYTLDTTGRATTIRNPLGQDTTLTWNGEHKVTKLTEPTGTHLSYSYNDNGYLTSTTDQNGNTTRLDHQNVAADINDVAGKWEAGRTIPHFSQLQYKTSPRGVATATADDYRWSFDYDARGNLTSTTDPTGAKTTLGINPDGTVATETDARSNVTRYGDYDANGFPAVVTDALGKHTRFGYDTDGNLRWVQDARHDKPYPGVDPRAYRTYLDYDAFGRMGRQSAPKTTEMALGTLIWTGADFDPNDNVVLEIDPHYGGQYTPGSAFQQSTRYDAMDRPTLRTAKDTSADPAGERTSMTYDAAGREVERVAPIGKRTGFTKDHTTETAYDLLDRVVRTAQHEVDNTGVLKNTLYSHRCYDLAGDLVRTVSPRANRPSISCTDDTVPFVTRYGYDAGHRQTSKTDPAGRVTRTGYDQNDNVTSRTDEGGQVETTQYDQRDMPIRHTRPYTGGTTPRVVTTLIEYDAAGNRSRVITPRAYDASTDKVTFTDYVTRYVYDADNQLIRTDLPTTAGAGAGDQHYRHQAYDAVGNLVTTTQEVTQDTLADVPQDKREDRSYFDPSGWIRLSDDHVNPPVHFDMDASGRQTRRVPEKKNSSDLDLSRQQIWRYTIDGKLAERGDGGGQKITYDYDADNVLIRMRDSSGVNAASEKTMVIEVFPDGLDRPAKTRQRKTDQARWTATVSTYDLNGNVVRRVDGIEEDDAGTQLEAGRRSDFTFDGTDRLTQQVDQGKDTQVSTSDDRRIRTTYLPQGWEQQRVTDKYVPGAASPWQLAKTQDWSYYDNGQLRTLATKNGSGDVLESHDVSYIDDNGRYVNGNQVKDTYQRKSPSSETSCSQSTCTARYTYDPRDRLVRHESGGSSTSYTLYPSGDIQEETKSSGTGSTKTSYTYKGAQVDTVSSGGTTLEHQYDARGDLDCVTGATGTQNDCNSGTGVQVDYSFDYLDRMTGYEDKTSGDSTTYTYDALDRLTRQEDRGTNARTTDFDFVGLTDSVSKEQQKGTDGSVTRTKTYSYDAYGSPNGMTDQQAGGTEKSYSYGKDPLGSISQLIDDSGHAAAAYGYRPYGEQDDQLTAGDKVPSSGDKQVINPVRFTEKRFDTASGTLQMGSRRFGPGTNHFLQEDRYDSALADLGLSTDPLTTNRYSLAGGNPANFVEYDGHFSVAGVLGDAKDAVRGAAKKVKRFYKTKVEPQVEKRKDKPFGDSDPVSKFVGQHASELAGTAVGVAQRIGGEQKKVVKNLRSSSPDKVREARAKMNTFRKSPTLRKIGNWGRSDEAKSTSRFLGAAGAASSLAGHMQEGDSFAEAGGKTAAETAGSYVGGRVVGGLAAAGCTAIGTPVAGAACGIVGSAVGGWAGGEAVKLGEKHWGDIENAAGDAADAAGDAADDVGDAADDAADEVGDAAGDVGDELGL